jgi:hypothetical protein
MDIENNHTTAEQDMIDLCKNRMGVTLRPEDAKEAVSSLIKFFFGDSESGLIASQIYQKNISEQ